MCDSSALLPTSSTTSYNVKNQISQSSLEVVQTDGSGDVISGTQNQYVYDAEGRICEVKSLLVGTMTGYIYGADIRNLTNRFQIHGQITQFVCVEGWTAIAWWAGVGLRIWFTHMRILRFEPYSTPSAIKGAPKSLLISKFEFRRRSSYVFSSLI